MEYAWAHHRSHAATLLIPARTAGGLTTALGELTAPLGLPAGPTDEARAASVLAWLNDHPGWLLILDNADSPQAMQAATALMGRLHGGHVLLTTRLTTLPGAFRRLPLDVLPREAAADLLLDASVGRRPAPDDRAQALMLAEALGGLALALTHAAAYVAARGLSLERYRGLLATAFDRLIDYSAPTVTQYERSTAATLALSVEQLTDAGRALLERLAFLAHAPVPDFLLDVPVPGLEEEDLTEALADLAAYSLVTRDLETGTFTVHRLVREITRHALPPDAARVRLTQALGWVDDAFTGNPEDVRDWASLVPLADHAESIADQARVSLIHQPTSKLFGACSSLAVARGQYERAESLMRSSLGCTRSGDIADSPDVIGRKAALADILRINNKMIEAEELIKEALKEARGSLGERNPLVGVCLNNFALICQYTGRPSEAVSLFRMCLENQKIYLPPDSPHLAKLHNNLANVLTDPPDQDEAEYHMLQAMKIDEAVFGENGINLGVRLMNLAELRRKRGTITGVEELYRRAFRIFEGSLDPTHTVIGHCVGNLALFLVSRERYDEAERLYVRALASFEKGYAADDPIVAICLHNFALLLEAVDRLNEAEPLMRRMVVILLKFQRATGHPHPHRELVLANHAHLLRAMGREEASIAAEQQAMHREAGLA